MMFMKWGRDILRLNVFILFGVLMISSVYAAESSTESQFNIRGCTFDFGELQVGVAADRCSDGDAFGEFFCSSGLIHYRTRDEGFGCSLGLDSYTLGDDFCCPSGMFCNETSAGLFRCDMRTANCVDQGDEGDCIDNGCIWMDIVSECTESARNYDCSYYNTETSCLEDKWDIGVFGAGTELCGGNIECAGKIFSIPKESCGCQWDDSAPEGDECRLEMSANEKFYDGIPDKFECSNVYTLGNCTDGQQPVIWSSSSENVSGFEATGGEIPLECLTALNCNSGESVRFCGEDLIKLPGFSLFSLFASLFIIGIYYFVLDRFKYKRGHKLL